MATEGSSVNTNLRTPTLNFDCPSPGAEDTDSESNIVELSREQSNVESLLTFLLNYNCNKKKVGRPKSIPTSVSESLKTVTDINDLHAGVLLDYLMKLSKLNKSLLNQFSILNNKYNNVLEQLNEIKSKNTNLQEINESLNFDLDKSTIASKPTDTSQVLIPNKEVKLLNDKIDYLEQSANSNVLICSGPIIHSNDNNNQSDNSINDKKSRIIDTVKKISPDVGDSNIINITPIGKDKKLVKITCDSAATKNRILKNARIKKLSNIYFREYLTSRRNKLFYELRQIKKNYPTKISYVYIRNGNVCYKLENSNRYHLIKDITDLHVLSDNLSNV